MASPRKRRRVAASVPGVELLRLAHLGAESHDPRKQNAAESIYSLLALQLKNDMVAVPVGMMPHYKTLAQ